MTHRHNGSAELDAAIAAGHDRFRKLPDRIAPADTFVSVPVTVHRPGRDGYHPDEWLTRNVSCGSLL
jgi:hypothetical protein